MNPAAFESLPTSACSLGVEGSFGPDRISKTVYDAAGQVTKLQVAFGTPDQADEVTTSYRPNGAVETLTDGEGNRTTYAYDGHHRLKQTRYPVVAKGALASNPGDYEELGYDAAGNVTSRRNRAGEVASYTFDALGRVTLKDLPGAEPDVSYGYDLVGNMLTASQPGHALGFTYDALGRQLSETGPRGTVSSHYDLAGRRTRLTWPDGFFVGYDHLVTGELSAVRENGASSGPGVLATFGYDDQGRRISLTRGNGASTSYAYDAASRLTQLAHAFPADGAKNLQLGFSHNPAGQITSNTRSNDAYASNVHGSGSLAYGADGLNRMTSWGATPVTYDARGNMLNDGRDRAFTFSSENLLSSYTTPSNGGVGVFTYDPLMRFTDSNPGTSSLRSFQYDGHDLVAEYGSSGQLIVRYIHVPGSADEPLALITPAGQRSWFHADERGSVVAVSGDSGVVVKVNVYDEYGRVGWNGYRFQYTGAPILTGTFCTSGIAYTTRKAAAFLNRTRSAMTTG